MADALEVKPKPKAAWPRVLTASTWARLYGALVKAAGSRLGHWPEALAKEHRDYDGYLPGLGRNVPVPRLLNSDVVTLMMAAWSSAESFWLWYQYAAAAYGWGYDGPDGDKLDLSSARGAEVFPLDLTIALWGSLGNWAVIADETGVPGPRLSLDGQWSDVVFAAQVRAALQQDGATASWKLPLPACKDPTTGKPVLPKLNPRTGKAECPGGPVLVDDPVTAIGKTVLTPFAVIALVLGALWLMDTDTAAPRRRRK